MSLYFTDGPMKIPVNITADGNIAQSGDTASGTKTISTGVLIKTSNFIDLDNTKNFLGLAMQFADLIGATYNPADVYLAPQIKCDVNSIAQWQAMKGAEQNGNS